MGGYARAEACELVWLYLLSKLAPLVDTKNAGLYRDDSSAVIHQVNGTKMDGRIRKKKLMHRSSLGDFLLPLTQT